MTRLAAAGLFLVVLAFPVAVYPAPPVTWIASVAALAGAAGVVLLAVPALTVGGALALVAYAVALLIARPPADPPGAIVFGAALTLLPLVVHFAARTAGAAVGAGVVAGQLREWALVVATGVVVAAALAVVGTSLAAVVQRASPPLVVAAAAGGAGVAMAGVVALLVRRREPRDTLGD